MNLTSKQWGIVILAVATAIIHIVLAFAFGGPQLVVFTLNGIGYLALVAALYFLPQFAGRRAQLRWALLAYTAVTFVLYFVANWPEIWGPVGLIDKAIELALLILLWQDVPAAQ